MVTLHNIKTGAEYQLSEAEFANLQDYDRRWRHKYKVVQPPAKPAELKGLDNEPKQVEKQKVTSKPKNIENLDK